MRSTVDRIDVKAGQVYTNKPFRKNAQVSRIRVMRVLKGHGQPKAVVERITKSNKPKKGNYLDEWKVWLTYNAKSSAWTMPISYKSSED